MSAPIQIEYVVFTNDPETVDLLYGMDWEIMPGSDWGADICRCAWGDFYTELAILYKKSKSEFAPDESSSSAAYHMELAEITDEMLEAMAKKKPWDNFIAHSIFYTITLGFIIALFLVPLPITDGIRCAIFLSVILTAPVFYVLGASENYNGRINKGVGKA